MKKRTKPTSPCRGATTRPARSRSGRGKSSASERVIARSRSARIPARIRRFAMHAFRFTVAACVLALMATHAAADDDVAAFYRGKTLQFTSAFAEGGLYSTVTRLVAEHLPRHLP